MKRGSGSCSRTGEKGGWILFFPRFWAGHPDFLASNSAYWIREENNSLELYSLQRVFTVLHSLGPLM